MGTRNNLRKFRPRRNKTYRSTRIKEIRKSQTRRTTITPRNIENSRTRKTIKETSLQRLKTDIVKRRRVFISKRHIEQERIKTTVIDRIRNQRSNDEERAIFTERKPALLEVLTNRSLTSKSAERTRRITGTSRLVDNIRTEKLTIGTKEHGHVRILQTTNIKLTIDIIGVARTAAHRKLQPTLNMRTLTNRIDRDRTVFSRNRLRNIRNT